MKTASLCRAALSLLLMVALASAGAPVVRAQSGADDAYPKGPSSETPSDKTISPSTAPAPQDLPTDQLIIKYKSQVEPAGLLAEAPEQIRTLSAAAGVALTYFREMSGDAHVLKLPQTMPVDEVQAIADRLAALPAVAYAEPDRIMQPLFTPNDPQYNSQWHYFAPTASQYGVSLPGAWDITTGDGSLRVAVVDTGILFNHPDLIGRTVGGYDFISNATFANDGGGRDADASDPGDWEAANQCFPGSSPSDSSWHGTHVAGTIGAATNNNIGAAGINWVSPILPVRVLGKCGGTISDIADGIRWAAGLSVSGVPNNTTPARVINISLGGSGACGPTFQTAVDAVVGAGTVVVAAAGNSNTDASGFTPANCNGVITVAATDRNGNRAPYSNYGAVVEIAAPGGDTAAGNGGVLSTLNIGRTSPGAHAYAWYQGTSMATPHVTGIVSLMQSLSPSLTPTQTLQIIQNTATSFPGTCTGCGSGIVNAYQSLSVLPRITTLNPGTVLTGTGPLTLTVMGANFANDAVVMWNGSDRTTSFVSSGELRASISAGDVTSSGVMTISVRGTDATYGSITTASRLLNVGLTQNLFLPWVARNGVLNASAAVTNGNFESGSVTWAEFSSNNVYPIIYSVSQGLPVTPVSGDYAAWMGGLNNEVSYVQQSVTVPANAPYLRFYRWMGSGDAPGYDFGRVKINGTTVLTFDLSQNTSGWVIHSVSLAAYAGQSVTLRFEATTDGSLISSWLLDDVSFSSMP